MCKNLSVAYSFSVISVITNYINEATFKHLEQSPLPDTVVAGTNKQTKISNVVEIKAEGVTMNTDWINMYYCN